MLGHVGEGPAGNLSGVHEKGAVHSSLKQGPWLAHERQEFITGDPGSFWGSGIGDATSDLRELSAAHL